MWNRILCSFCLIFVLACGTTPFLARQGFLVNPNGHTVKQSEVEIAIDLLKSVFVSQRVYTKEQTEKAFSCPGYTVEVRSGKIPCPTKKKPKRTCSGLHQGGSNTILYTHNKDLYKTSFVHELIHMVKYKLEGDADGEHLDVFVWEQACKTAFQDDEEMRITCEMNSVEGFTNSMLRGILENG